MDIILYYASLLSLPLLVVGWPLVAWRHWVRGAMPPWGLGRAPLTAALLGAPVFAVWAVVVILQGTSSTAPLGLLMVPIYSLIVGVWLALAVWAIQALRRDSGEGSPGSLARWRRPLAALLLVLLAWWPARAAYGELLIRRARDAAPADLAALAENPFARRDLRVLAAVAAHPSAPPAVLADLAARAGSGLRRPLDEGLRALLLPPPGGGRSVRALVAAHPRTPAAALHDLAADPSPAVRAAVAANPGTPPGLLRRLEEDPALPVRIHLAARPGAPPELLDRMASSQSVYVRLQVAANPSTPPAALARLSGDEDPRVRFRLTTNPSLPDDLLRDLAKDADEKVSSYAVQKLQRTRELEEND